MPQVTIEKLVYGGQGIGSLPDGRKVFVWGALPGETVEVKITKNKQSYAEGIAEKVVANTSAMRIAARESNYLATSPWQIIALRAENEYKQTIVEELFQQAKVIIPRFTVKTAGDEWHYRNKMEYSFWGDDEGLSLALYARNSHQKVKVLGSELAMAPIDTAARDVCALLQSLTIRAGDLKTIIVRCSQDGKSVASLFVKKTSFPKLTLPESLEGLRVYYSNPKSPASVSTKLLEQLGDVRLCDELLGRSFTYDVDSFFQVNPPVFEQALTSIKTKSQLKKPIVDMYAGVGTIGLSLDGQFIRLVESDYATAVMARVNAAAMEGVNAEVIEAPSETVLDYITPDVTVLFDPPRAGLHDKVVERTLESLPSQVVYLSCNPATQARDLAKLQPAYDVAYFEAFNFFPHTPHIETLAILKKR